MACAETPPPPHSPSLIVLGSPALSYVISMTYAGCDAVDKGLRASRRYDALPSAPAEAAGEDALPSAPAAAAGEKTRDVVVAVAATFVWQTLASVVRRARARVHSALCIYV